MTDFFPLEVIAKRFESADAVTLTLGVPSSARKDFAFVPGQNLTLRAVVDGKECCRAYSISRAPVADRLDVMVKRLQHGRFSTFACDRLLPGMFVDAQPPLGAFTLASQPSGARTIVAFAAGSGIASVMAIVEHVLESEPKSRLFLIYGNRDRSSIIFREIIRDLKDHYVGRFSVHHVLSREPQELALCDGRIDAEKVARVCRALCPPDIVDTYLLCAPGNVSDVVRDELLDRGVAPERIRIERFAHGAPAGAADVVRFEDVEDDANSEIIVFRDGSSVRFVMPRGERNILDYALRAGIDLPYSCRVGACGACRAKLVHGRVEMDRSHALRPEEISAGFVLACRGRPVMGRVVLDFDEALRRRNTNLVVGPRYDDVIHSLRGLVASQPDAVLYTFLKDGDDEAISFSRQDVDRVARSVAAELTSRGLQGRRVLIALAPGLDYVASVFGCLYAGAVAVPAMFPVRDAERQRIANICADCRPSAAILNQSRSPPPPEWDGLAVLDADELMNASASNYDEPAVSRDDVAFLQYTSGSTGVPKGTMVTRGNLSHNSWLLSEVREHAPYIGVSWLPPHHDMGLVGGIFHAAFTGCPAVLMNPMHFLQRPVRWLRAITRYRASLSPAPDFAFRLCIERIRPDERKGLDLSSWSFAFCGAEPVRKKTLDQFTETFAPYGFRRESFMPCYGLAESTLIVASKRGNGHPRELNITSRSLEACKRGFSPAGTADSCTLISTGRPASDLDVRIVDPANRCEVPEGLVGEIWIHGPSVASGYWGRLEDETFGARIAGDPNGKRYLRTGDLGFFHAGELYVSGRIKNLILVRGRNLHAEDVEQSAAQGHELLDPGACAAFTIDDGAAEDVALVAEVELRRLPDQQVRTAELTTMLDGIRASIARHHGVVPAIIAIVRRGSLPRTPSGKLRRHTYRSMLASGKLTILAAWRRPAEGGP